jgi:hypothetical protein
VWVAWSDSRFQGSGTSNDIVYTTSSDGRNWSTITRVPIDATGSGSKDKTIPAIAIDPTTSGSTAKVGLYYYFYPQTCSDSSCQLSVGYISSTNGGSSWSTAQTVAGPMTLAQLANTSQGYMVGDYSGNVAFNGTALGVFAVGKPGSGSTLDEAMYTNGAMPITGGSTKAATGPVYNRVTPSARGGTASRAI